MRLLRGLGFIGGALLVLFLPWVAWQIGGFGQIFWLIVFLIGVPLIAYGDKRFYNHRRKDDEDTHEDDKVDSR